MKILFKTRFKIKTIRTTIKWTSEGALQNF